MQAENARLAGRQRLNGILAAGTANQPLVTVMGVVYAGLPHVTRYRCNPGMLTFDSFPGTSSTA
jgi:hypothetical protein